MKMVVFEGIDASGKETQVRMLSSILSSMGYQVATVAFPRYWTHIGGLIKKGLKREIGMSEETLHGLLELDRYDFMNIIDAYKNCDFLILDRFILSNLAFGMAKGLDIEWLKAMQKRLPIPDLTFVLDITAETSYKRKSGGYDFKELDKHELDSSLLNRARMAYLTLANQISKIDCDDQLVYVIDANTDPITIHGQVLEIIKLALIENEADC